MVLHSRTQVRRRVGLALGFSLTRKSRRERAYSIDRVTRTPHMGGGPSDCECEPSSGDGIDGGRGAISGETRDASGRWVVGRHKAALLPILQGRPP